MTMIRDDRQVALDNIIVAAKMAACHYEEEAALLAEDKLASFFRELAAERRELAARLSVELRYWGDLPSDPDPDQEKAEQMLTKVKTALIGEKLVVLRERKEKEEELVDLLAAALKHDLRSEARTVLEKHQRQAVSVVRLLEEAERNCRDSR